MNGYVSLFAGIGGLDLAAEALGYECVGQVEWDAACSAVLERHWPDVPRWGDVREFGAAAYAERGGQEQGHEGGPELRGRDTRHEHRRSAGSGVSLITAGFPCQPASTAGKRKGTADDRWLWPEVARVTSELRPDHLLVENVAGLLTVNGGRAFSDILSDLAAMGYDATWTSLRASDVGACHRRERIFILATDTRSISTGAGRPGRSEAGQEVAARDPLTERPDTDSIGLGVVGQGLLPQRHRGEPQPGPGGLGAESAHAAAQRLQGAEPNRQQYKLGAHAGDGRGFPWLPLRGEHGPRQWRNWTRVERAGWTGRDYEELYWSQVEPSRPAPFPWGRYAGAIARHERAFGRTAPHPIDDRGRLDPRFVEWMQAFPEGWTDGMSRTQALKALGNAVVWPQAAEAFRRLLVASQEYAA